MEQIEPRSSTLPGWLLVLLAAYFAVHVIVRLVLPDTLGLDEAEQVFRLQWLSAGYGAQPPFYNWLQYSVFSVAGVSVATLAIVKNGILLASYLLCALTARLLLRDRMFVAVATLGLLTIPQVVFEMQRDLTHTVAVFFAASMFIYGFFLTAKRPSFASYAITGIAIGVGLLSKYNFLLLPGAAFLAAMTDQTMRSRIFDWRLLITASITVVVDLPHAMWLKDNLPAATARTLDKLKESDIPSYPLQVLTGTGSLLMAILGFAIVTVIVFAIAFRKPLMTSLRASSADIRLLERIVLFALLGIMVLIIFGGATNIKDRWLVPILFVTPLYFCMKLEAAGYTSKQGVRRFTAIALFVMIAIPIALFARVGIAGFTHHYERGNIPFAQVAQILKAQANPGLIVANSDWTGGNMGLRFPEATVISPSYPPKTTPIEVTDGAPVLLLWDIGDTKEDPVIPPTLGAWLQVAPQSGWTVSAPQAIDLPYHYAADGDAYRFGYAWVNGPAR
jgi:lipopolysaccharide core galacturonosyltransferase RgtB